MASIMLHMEVKFEDYARDIAAFVIIEHPDGLVLRGILFRARDFRIYTINQRLRITLFANNSADKQHLVFNGLNGAEIAEVKTGNACLPELFLEISPGIENREDQIRLIPDHQLCLF